MSVKNSYAIPIAVLSEWLKNLAPLLQPMNTPRTRLLLRFGKLTGNMLQ